MDGEGGNLSVCVSMGDPKDMSRRPCPFGNQPAVENQCPFGAVFGMFHVHLDCLCESGGCVQNSQFDTDKPMAKT